MLDRWDGLTISRASYPPSNITVIGRRAFAVFSDVTNHYFWNPIFVRVPTTTGVLGIFVSGLTRFRHV